MAGAVGAPRTAPRSRSGPGTIQQFRFVDSGDGYYRLKARCSGKLLDVSSWSTADSEVRKKLGPGTSN
ncbi:RICIN domain-containing protein [Streptomyces sp. NPDC032198]|uniref:RICIN domain-containing protein n=1 Tax=Streptomyces sp. NPDC032198 TaxID=3155127 RepID=UPI0033D81046